MAESVECVVVGAGAVGLAVARCLALCGREVLVLEQEGRIGAHTSSRNSEVIHAGLHYPKGSLRARLFPQARDALYAYCQARNVPHRRLGKLVVACEEEQVPQLKTEFEGARTSGVDDLQWLDGDKARHMEPALQCCAAYLSPSSGIVDSHSLMYAYHADIERAGGQVVLRAAVLNGVALDRRFRLEIGGAESVRLECRILVNCAGLEASALACRIAGIPVQTIPQTYFRRGTYFSVAGRPFGRLIYPAKEKRGRGIHAVVDLAGEVRFGPDTEFIERIDYTVAPERAANFYPAIRRFWPQLADGMLQPAYAGIRPTISPPGAPPVDFLVHGPMDHGLPGLVNLFGIESPGLTASLALAQYVLSLLETRSGNGAVSTTGNASPRAG